MKNLDLHRAARAIDLPPGDLDTVTARGATLARRRHRVLAGGLVIALVVAGNGLYARMNQPKPVPVAAGGASAKRGDVPIRWEKVASRSGLGFTMTMSEEALYAVSTAPGRGSPEDTRRFVWHSEDGVDWSAVTELKNDLYVANLADRGARLYGVGTGPAGAAVAGRKPVADLVVGSSDDGGRNWARQTLPVDMRAISAKSRSVGVYAVDVATTKDAVVAVATLMAELDVPSVLPAGKTAPHGWALTETGVDVLGTGPECPAGTATSPPGVPDKRAAIRNDQGDTGPGREYRHECYGADGAPRHVTPQETRGVTESFTWAQLNVAGDLLRAVRSEPMVFRSDAGTLRFDRVDAPEVAKLDGPGMLARDRDGLILVGQTGTFPGDATFPGGTRGAPTSAILRSPDGRSWTSAAAPAGFSYALAVGQLGDNLAIIGETASGPTLWVSDAQGAWSATSLAGAVDPNVVDKSNVSLAAAGIGPLGVVAVVGVMPDKVAERGGVKITQDGYTLHIINDRWAGYVTDRAGKEVARSESVMDMRGNGVLRSGNADGSVSLVDPETGAVRVRFATEDIRKNLGDAMRGSESFPTYRIVASRDGLTWSDEDVSALAGEKITMVVRVLMTGERAVVALSPPAANDREAPKQLALIGTPR